jgi:hypothetical protein
MSHAAILPKRRRYPLWALPVVALWKVITFFASAMGILLSLTIGALCMFLGFALTATIAGAVIGVPLFVIGLLLFVRGLW